MGANGLFLDGGFYIVGRVQRGCVGGVKENGCFLLSKNIPYMNRWVQRAGKKFVTSIYLAIPWQISEAIEKFRKTYVFHVKRRKYVCIFPTNTPTDIQ